MLYGMEKEKSFGIVLDECLHIPNCIRMILVQQYHYILSWNSSTSVLSICQIKSGNADANSETFKEKLYKQNFSVSTSIVDIICAQAIHLIFLVNGLIYQLENISNSSGYENDENLFASSSSEELNVFQLKERGQLQECDKVIAVCPIEDGFAVLANKEGSAFLQLYNLYDLIPRFVVPVQVRNGTCGVLCSCLTKQISLSLRRHLFPDLELLDEEIVLVGLSSGVVGWFSTHSPSKGLQTLCCAVQPIKILHWITDPSSAQHSGLVIILSNGLVMTLISKEDSLKSHTLFLPGDVKTAACIGDKIVISDGIDCSLNQLCFQESLTIKSSTLPVKGVQCICKAVDTNNTLIVGTIHKSIYFINTSVSPVGNAKSFVMPDQRLLDGIMYNTQQLDKVIKEMDTEDMIMQAVSATSIVNSLTDLFQVTILIYPGEKLMVTIKMTEDAFVFNSEIWKIHLELTNDKNNQQSVLTKLQHNLTHQSDLVVDMFCQVTVASVLNCRLVAVVEEKLPWLIVHLGKVNIDACYLLEPIHFLQSGYSLLLETETAQSKSDDCIVYIKLPSHIQLNSFFTLLLKDVQHRISGDTMKMLTAVSNLIENAFIEIQLDGRKISQNYIYLFKLISTTGDGNFVVEIRLNDKRRVLHTKLGNSLVEFSLDEQKCLLTISCSDAQICHEVKSAVVMRFSKPGNRSVDTNLFLEIQSLHQILEIQRLKTSLDIKEISTIKRRLRSEASAHLIL